MANGDGNGKNGSQWVSRWIVGGGGLLAVVLAFAVNVAKDAQIALDVAAQHGQEILILHSEVQALEEEVRDRTRNRYTSKDAERDIGYLRRDLDQCMAWRGEHMKTHHKKL